MILVARAFFDVKTNQINLLNYDYLEPDQGVKKEARVTLYYIGQPCVFTIFYEFGSERARFMALKTNQINSSMCRVKGFYDFAGARVSSTKSGIKHEQDFRSL